jgi:PAS domain S-box-containing protein
MEFVLILALAVALGLAAVVCALLVRRMRRAETKAAALHAELLQYAEEASSEIEASQQRFQDLVRVSPVGIFEADESGSFLYVSARWREMTGLEDKRGLGDGWLEVVFEEEREQVRSEWLAAVATRTVWERELRMLQAEGEPIWVWCQATPRAPKSGGRGSWVGTLTDVTERRRLGLRVQNAQKLESLGVMAGGVAHDFNNLLLGILGNAELARARSDPQTTRFLERIEVAAERASDLARQMLAYSGRGRASVESVELSALVEEMVELLAATHRHREISRELERELPVLRGDATQIRQVIMNLVANAVESVSDDDGRLHVRTGLRRLERDQLAESYVDDGLPGGEYVFLEVADDGCGMDEETVSRIFEPFFTTKFTGRGLGLAVVLGIVRGHRGAIEVDSSPNGGTTIRVFFPASERPVAVQPPPAVTRDDWSEEGLVLVVDDEEMVLETVEAMLLDAGLVVITALGGATAVERFAERASEIDLVLLDMTMPGMNGEQVFHELQRIRPSTRVVLASGFPQEDALGRFSGEGLAGYIQKPYRQAELLTRLREASESGST